MGGDTPLLLEPPYPFSSAQVPTHQDVWGAKRANLEGVPQGLRVGGTNVSQKTNAAAKVVASERKKSVRPFVPPEAVNGPRGRT